MLTTAVSSRTSCLHTFLYAHCSTSSWRCTSAWHAATKEHKANAANTAAEHRADDDHHDNDDDNDDEAAWRHNRDARPPNAGDTLARRLQTVRLSRPLCVRRVERPHKARI